MDVNQSSALVTGANRGLGAAFCRALGERGAATIYGGARQPDTVIGSGVTPLQLDITSSSDIKTAAKRCSDVRLLINNAGTLTPGSLLEHDTITQGRLDFETNVFATAEMCRAFAPVLAANGGGVIVNVLSVLSWYSAPGSAMYCASKAAAWSLTNALRQELHGQGIAVMAVHVGLMDTDMAAAMNGLKTSPDEVARLVLDGVATGLAEVLVDDASRRVRSALSGDLATLYPFLA